MKAYLQRLFINWLVKDLFNAVSAEDILRITPQGVFYKRKQLSADSVEVILGGARYITDSVAWKMMLNEAKYMANQHMFEKSKSVDDIMFGKAMLYCIEILEKKLDHLSKL